MRYIAILFALTVMAMGCTKSLELPNTEPDNTILVVEGDIKTGSGTENIFKLSRLKPLFQFDEVP